jgi:hypothetical protein
MAFPLCLAKRAPMDGGEGKLTAVLAVLPAEQLMRFDFSVPRVG